MNLVFNNQYWDIKKSNLINSKKIKNGFSKRRCI